MALLPETVPAPRPRLLPRLAAAVGAAAVAVAGRPDGSRALTLTPFRTDPGPDLYVYVVPRPAPDGDVDGGTRLARLKGNVGDQQYALPADLELGEAATVAIRCRAFSVAFGAAALAAV